MCYPLALAIPQVCPPLNSSASILSASTTTIRATTTTPAATTRPSTAMASTTTNATKATATTTTPIPPCTPTNYSLTTSADVAQLVHFLSTEMFGTSRVLFVETIGLIVCHLSFGREESLVANRILEEMSSPVLLTMLECQLVVLEH
ncbi:unnamed protein product [Rotaria sordida]|uniref:Uncharacterized protein n=1 Tax=Rotaria sordida TaxID=392033 RepID=A0A815GWT2_9BILA|nr:unnamed protein product [Rotaria sordida]